MQKKIRDDRSLMTQVDLISLPSVGGLILNRNTFFQLVGGDSTIAIVYALKSCVSYIIRTLGRIKRFFWHEKGFLINMNDDLFLNSVSPAPEEKLPEPRIKGQKTLLFLFLVPLDCLVVVIAVDIAKNMETPVVVAAEPVYNCSPPSGIGFADGASVNTNHVAFLDKILGRIISTGFHRSDLF